MTRAAFTASVATAALVAACAGILGVRQGAERAFEHRAHAVKGVACVQCHTSVARAGLSEPLDLPDAASCQQCHSEPHDTRPCGACHGKSEHRERVAQAKHHLRFSHRDHIGAASGGCTRCHEGVLSETAPLRPTMATCLSCHEHRQDWNTRACAPCHVGVESEGSLPESHVVHGRDFVKRHGMHAASARDLCETCHTQRDCADCHALGLPALPATLRFDEPRRAELHGQGFLARHSLEARIDPGLCSSCHAEERVCIDCHAREKLLRVDSVRASPHPSGWVGTRGSQNAHGMEARRNPLSCASCHGGGGETLCVGCHRVGGAGGNPHPAGFGSSKPLHELPCRMCHGGSP